VEVHANFVQWIEWRGDGAAVKCSGDTTWAVEYKYAKQGSALTKIYNRIGTVSVNIPDAPTVP